MSVSPVSQWVDKVQAAVDAVVLDVPPVEARLIPQVLVVPLIAVVNHWLPTEVVTEQ